MQTNEQLGVQLSRVRNFVLSKEGRKKPEPDVGLFRSIIKSYHKKSYGVDVWLCSELNNLPDLLLEPVASSINDGL